MESTGTFVVLQSLWIFFVTVDYCRRGKPVCSFDSCLPYFTRVGGETLAIAKEEEGEGFSLVADKVAWGSCLVKR